MVATRSSAALVASPHDNGLYQTCSKSTPIEFGQELTGCGVRGLAGHINPVVGGWAPLYKGNPCAIAKLGVTEASVEDDEMARTLEIRADEVSSDVVTFLRGGLPRGVANAGCE